MIDVPEIGEGVKVAVTLCVRDLPVVLVLGCRLLEVIPMVLSVVVFTLFNVEVLPIVDVVRVGLPVVEVVRVLLPVVVVEVVLIVVPVFDVVPVVPPVVDVVPVPAPVPPPVPAPWGRAEQTASKAVRVERTKSFIVQRVGENND